MNKSNLSTSFFFLLLALVAFSTYKVLQPFLVALVLAFIFSQLFKSWYEKIYKGLGERESLASIVTCFLILLAIIIPIGILATLTFKETSQLLQNIQDSQWKISFDSLASHPAFERIDKLAGLDVVSLIGTDKLAQFAQNIGNFTFNIIRVAYQSITQLVLMTFVMFFALYYFFKEDKFIIKKLVDLSPLTDKEDQLLIDKFISISQATIKGSFVIALIQGILTGIILAIAGVPSAIIWGTIAVFFSLLPMFGAGLVWFPAGVILLLTGNIWQGVFVIIAGALVVSLVDNILRPLLVGNQASLHPLLVLLSTFGGIAFFGLLGIILGPVIVVLFFTLLQIYNTDFKSDFNAKPPLTK